MRKIHTTSIAVRYGETDALGVVWHGSYVGWLEVARSDHMAVSGLTYADFIAAGYALVVSDLRMRYLRPARYGDVVLVESELVRVQSRRLTIDYRLIREEDGALLMTASTQLICVTGDGQVTTFPGEWRALFAGTIEG